MEDKKKENRLTNIFLIQYAVFIILSIITKWELLFSLPFFIHSIGLFIRRKVMLKGNVFDWKVAIPMGFFLFSIGISFVLKIT